MKAVLLYLVLVVPPVAGIYGIVYLGQELKPPISVAGEWNVELIPRTADTVLCKGFIGSPKLLILKVMQTGPHLALTLNDQSATRLAGEVKFERLNASSFDASTITSPIQLQANIDRESGFDRLSGTLTFANCPAGSEFSFTAIRRQKGAGAGH